MWSVKFSPYPKDHKDIQSRMQDPRTNSAKSGMEKPRLPSVEDTKISHTADTADTAFGRGVQSSGSPEKGVSRSGNGREERETTR